MTLLSELKVGLMVSQMVIQPVPPNQSVLHQISSQNGLWDYLSKTKI